MASKKTILVRMDKEFVEKVRLDYPDIPVNHILKISYRRNPLINANMRLKKILK